MKTTAVLLSALASVAVAQQQYTIDPASVSDSTRNAWCSSQTTQCPLICLQLPGSVGANANTCNSKLLQYNCVCTNGQTPNITEYTQTLPWYICTTWQEQCVANCGHDNNCALACRTQHPCGALTPKKAVTSSAVASATGSVNGIAASTAAAAQTNPTAPAATITTYTGAGNKPFAIEFGQTWGLGLVIAGLFGSFAILL